jgi:DNA-binding winged helix-turn-helix (wHTH) protein
MEALPNAKFRFDEFELDCAKRELRHRGQPVALKSKTFDLLQYLVQNHGKLLTKNELLENVWPGQFVEENNLTVQVSALRKIFAAREASGVIKTIPGKGYTFIGEPEEAEEQEELIVEQRSFSRVIIEEHEALPPKMIGREATGARGAVKHVIAGATAMALLLAMIGLVYWRTSASPAKLDYKFSGVTSSGDVGTAAITPDGRYAVFSRKSAAGEGLFLRQFQTGSEQQIVVAKPLRYVGLAVSPNGDYIFATTFSPDLPDPRLFRIPLLGGLPEFIPNITTGATVSLSPDGSRIAYTESRSSMKQTQLLVSNADGSGKKVIARAEDDRRSFPNFNVNPVSWSPDGRWIAVAVEERGDGIKHGILLVSPDTGEERMLGEARWMFLSDLGWIDNEHIAFSASPPELTKPQLWSISRQTGESVRLTNEIAGYGAITVGGGAILAVRQNASSRLMAGELDPGGGKLELTEVFSESGPIDNVEFTRDGSIIYSSAASGRRELWRLKAVGSGERLTNGAEVAYGLGTSPVDDQVAFGSVSDERYVLKLASLDGKPPRIITDGPEDANPNFSPDGRSLVFQKGIFNRMITAWKIDLAGFGQTQLTQNVSSRPILSPDGTRFSYYFMDGIEGGVWKVGLASAVDGSFIAKRAFPVPVTERRIKWFDDSTLVQVLYSGEEIHLLLLPVAEGEHKVIPTSAKGDVQSFAISKDQKRIVFSTAELRDDLVLFTSH